MMSDAWQGYLRGEEVNIAEIVKEHSSELLERANEQKPAEWSEEDEKIGKELMDFCIKCGQGHTIVNSQDDFRRWTTWLKSLKDRYTWKPSDEQMKWFRDILDYHQFSTKGQKIMQSLYDDLKKLIEE